MYRLCICPRFHKQLQQSKQHKSYLTCLQRRTTVQIPVKEKLESKLTTKFPVSFQNTVQNSFHYLHSSGRFQWLTAIHAQLKHFHNCSPNQGCYLMHLRNPDQLSQTGGVHMSPYSRSVVNQQSQHQVPLCLQCHDGSYLSFSQHSSTYTARQTTMLQASISRLPVSANIRQAPLLLHTTEPQVSNYSRITLQMWQLNQGHWQSKLDPPGSHANVSQCVATKPRSPTLQALMPTFLNVWQLTKPRSPTLQVLMPMFLKYVWQLNQGHRPSRFSCQCFSLQLSSPGMTPGSVAPRTVHSVRPGSATTLPTCRDVTLSYFSNMDLCSTLPSSPFLVQFFQMLSSDSPGSLSLSCQSH